MKKLAPVAFFTYNRLDHTRRSFQALKNNQLADKTELFVFSDAAKTDQQLKEIEQVRSYLSDQTEGFKNIEIIRRRNNFGLADSIISGVSRVLKDYEHIIVIEDDISTSPFFLDFMNQMLSAYHNQKQVFSVSGYNHPAKLMPIPADYPYDVYFCPRCSSWGWGTWKDRWNQTDWTVADFQNFKNSRGKQSAFNQGGQDLTQQLIKQQKGKLDSWAIRWCYTLFVNQALCLYPVKSYTNNIGFDGTGVHCGKERKYQNLSLNQKTYLKLPQKIEVNETIMKQFRNVYRPKPLTRFLRMAQKIAGIFRD